ncbi:topoisomerase DNA-binding C4 zinc finger domain-containing protein, partial [bacterium]|nr:topoisomerase DNA-binding C4 zinc finger domain-containing protein [bacterium]
AHEAIRPITIETIPEDISSYLTSDMSKLYDLIWRRTTASFMSETQIRRFTLKITQGEAEFKILSETIEFQGYNKVYNNVSVKENPGVEKLTVNQELSTEKFDKLQNFTQPKPRYSEASLIKELEEKGIGRPSTYASIVGTLYERAYASRFEKRMRPTDLGIIVSRMLDKNFTTIINEDFTAHMEKDLDLIENGKMEWKNVIDEFYQKLNKIIKLAEKEIPRVLIKTDQKCEKCKKEMYLKFAVTGKFLACCGYPRCKNTVALPEDELFLVGVSDFDSDIVKIEDKLEKITQKTVESVDTGQKCEKCGESMVLKNGRYGAFMACSSYPKCKNTKPIPKTLGMKCLKENCEGEIVIRRTRKGKRFYGCSEYPKCDYVSWTKPQIKNNDTEDKKDDKIPDKK